jgi:putative phosphoribosyl transferase
MSQRRWREQLPFHDRTSAGEALAAAVAAEVDPADAVVLAIPRGGLPVAVPVARLLGVPLDVLVAHKIGAPWQPELAIGAVAADGTRVIDTDGELWSGDEVALRETTQAELNRALERQAYLRGNRPPLDLTGLTAILIDDGMAMGATMVAAAGAARRAGAIRVIAAVPVASAEAVARVQGSADQVIVLATPEPFGAVGLWYEEFDQVTDSQAAALLHAGELVGSA